MRILLISANTEQINMPVLPLGMACVAAAVENAGHDVKTINLMARKNTNSFLEKNINDFQPQVIGISVRNIDDQSMENTNFMLKPVKQVVSQCRQVSDSPIVLGGPGYSIFPEQALEYLQADMGIQGEGEAAFTMLLKQLEKNASISKISGSKIPGLFLPNKGLQYPVEFRDNLDDFIMPLPITHLNLPESLEKQKIRIPFQTRRGCPMNCSYCSTGIIEGRKLRQHSIEKAVNNLAKYERAGFKNFFFVDNTFNLPSKYAYSLCDEIIKQNLKIKWCCIIYPKISDEKLVAKMAHAGCVEVALGFESGSHKILSKMNKKFTPKDIVYTSNLFKKHGIVRMGFLMFGGPGETKDTIQESLEFADSLDLESMKITMGIRIYPYTGLSKIAKTEGLIKSDSQLLVPKFYIVEHLKDWLCDTLKKEVSKDHPEWMI